MEGFDLVGSSADLLTANWGSAEGTVYVGTGRFGGNCYGLPNDSNTVLSTACSSEEYKTFSFWYKTPTILWSYICGLTSNPAPTAGPSSVYSNMHISLLTDGSLEVFGDSASKFITSVGTIQADTWHHIEIQIWANFAGEAHIYVDGILAGSITGTDFYDAANAAVVFYGASQINYFDDIVIQTDPSSLPPLLGEHKIHALIPNADTAQADFTGTYADIDEPVGGGSDGDTSYISSSTLNAESEFDLTALPESPVTIHAVSSRIEARKTDAGTIGVTHHIDSAGVHDSGAEFGVSETYSTQVEVHDLNPNGNVAWDEAAVNALKIGVKITS